MNSANTANLSLNPPRTAIVIGASARACAQSLVRAGITPIAIDLFADRDLKQIARTHVCPMEEYPHGIPEILRTQLCDIPPDVPVILTGAMENHVDVLREIQSIRPLYGATADAIDKARAFDTLAHAAAASGVDWITAQPRYPSDTSRHELARISKKRWLLKPVKSGAGLGITRFTLKGQIPRPRPGQDAYYQRECQGLAFSMLFTHADGDTRPAGCTFQIVGDTAFGARHATQYVGNFVLPLPKDQIAPWTLLGQAITRHTGLSGVFGVDAIWQPQSAFFPKADRYSLLEVNPRYTAGMETLERSFDHSIFRWPVEAPATTDEFTCGKAIVYAKADCRVPDLYASISRVNIADVPEPGDLVPQGRPICTVLVQAPAVEVIEYLRRLAHTVYTLCKT